MKQKVKDYWVSIFEDGSLQIQCIWNRDAENNGFGNTVADDDYCDVSCEDCFQLACPHNAAYND